MSLSETNVWALLCLILFVSALALYWVGFKPVEDEVEACQELVDSLDRVNAERKKEIELLLNDLKEYKETIDSLDKVKRKVIKEYVDIYEKIDTASAPTIVTEFERIFPKSTNK